MPNLRVLTVGPLPPNPSELLSSKKMQEMLAILREEADIVVIDSPPVTVVSDTAIIAGHADGVLLVMRSGHTREDFAERSLRILRQVDARVLGAILNSAPVKNGGYDYDYGHKYGYSYGYTGGATNVFTRRRKRNKGTGTPATPAAPARLPSG